MRLVGSCGEYAIPMSPGCFPRPDRAITSRRADELPRGVREADGAQAQDGALRQEDGPPVDVKAARLPARKYLHAVVLIGKPDQVDGVPVRIQTKTIMAARLAHRTSILIRSICCGAYILKPQTRYTAVAFHQRGTLLTPTNPPGLAAAGFLFRLQAKLYSCACSGAPPAPIIHGSLPPGKAINSARRKGHGEACDFCVLDRRSDGCGNDRADAYGAGVV